MSNRNDVPFYMRGMMLIMNLNGRIKKDFDKSLANLDEYLKKYPKSLLINGYSIEESKFPANDYLAKRAIVKMQDISSYFSTHLPEIGKLAGANVKGVPSGLYWDWDEVKMQADMAAAMPVSDKNIKSDVYSVISVPASNEFVLHYYGSYDNMQGAHETLDSVIKMNGHSYPEMVVEEYITDPGTQKDTTQWYTKIHYLVK